MLVDLKKVRNDIEKNLQAPLERYRFQAVGFDTRYMYLNCFLMSKDAGLVDWRTSAISSCEKGNAWWGIVYTIDKRKFSRFGINSSR